MTSRPKHRTLILNATTCEPVCPSVLVADSFLTRLIGLLGRTGLNPEEGLLIQPSSGVHTFGMRFPIDIVALDRRNRVLGAWSNVGPWKIRGLNLRTRSVLELAAGTIVRLGLAAGDQLRIDHIPADSPTAHSSQLPSPSGATSDTTFAHQLS